MLTVAIDATPAAVQRAGVGRYCRELLRAMVEQFVEDHFKLVTAADSRAAHCLLDELPPGAWRETRRLPAGNRAMTALWQRLRVPLPVDRFAGEYDVFHGTDFVLPPTRRPSVVTIHDLSYLLHPEYADPDLVAYLRAAVPRAVKRADAVITVSAAVAAEVANAYPFVRDRIAAIPNGVRFAGTGLQRRVERDRPLILMVGTVEPRKGHETLLAAMNEVWDRCSDVELVVAGRYGWQADGIVERLEMLEANGRLAWYPNCSDQELEQLYAQATVFVYPSRYEGFGLPVLEAMARGIPVVASDVPAIREVADDHAVLTPPDEPSALASAILQLLDSRTLRDRLSEMGVTQARARTWEETARRTRRVYERVSGGR